jgi:hypothetical protein
VAFIGIQLIVYGLIYAFLIVVDGLKAYFEQFGQVIDCHIMRDPTGKSRCFGFVNFSDPSIPDVILQKTHILDGKQVLIFVLDTVINRID